MVEEFGYSILHRSDVLVGALIHESGEGRLVPGVKSNTGCNCVECVWSGGVFQGKYHSHVVHDAQLEQYSVKY